MTLSPWVTLKGRTRGAQFSGVSLYIWSCRLTNSDSGGEGFKRSGTPHPRDGAPVGPILGYPLVNTHTLRRITTKFVVVTHMGRSVFSGFRGQPRPIPRGRAPSAPKFLVFSPTYRLRLHPYYKINLNRWWGCERRCGTTKFGVVTHMATGVLLFHCVLKIENETETEMVWNLTSYKACQQCNSFHRPTKLCSVLPSVADQAL